MASTSTQGGTASLFVAPRRVPLTEMPLRNYIERPPSPLKSYSSPSKTQQTSIATSSSTKPKSHSPSPSRPSSIHVDVSSRHQLFREALRKSDNAVDTMSRKSSPLEDQENNTSAKTPPIFVSPRAVKVTSIRAPSTPVSSTSSNNQSPIKQASSQTSPLKAASSTSVPQSLGKKRERIRRQLFDEDEDGPASDIRTGSPSPSKLRAEREVTLLGDISGRRSKDHKEKQAVWTVWQDEEAKEASVVNDLPCSSTDEDKEEMEEDKENIRPVFRKKGTGGRLSLLATADDTESEQSFDLQEKRRKVTPLQYTT